MHEAGAAVVAAQLLAFYREPVRYRTRLTHGHELFGGGLLVFRFAHGKFSHALMRDLTVSERERLRLAATFFIRQVCLWEGATHYQVLCLPADARREVIKEHYQGLIALLHPDRQDASSEHWPAGAAQRVNQAYAVLCDEEQRRHYDAGLHTARASVLADSVMDVPLTAAARSPIVGRFAATRIRMRRPALLLSAVVASLFFAQVWWFGDLPREYATLAAAVPFDISSRWVRNVRSGSERPRFMGTAESQGPSQARPPDAAAEAPVPFLTPLWRALSNRAPEAQPAPGPQDGTRVASVEAPASPPRVEAAPPRVEAVPPRVEAVPPRVETPVQRVSPPVARGESRVVAQAAAPAALAPANDAALSAADMEMLVARVVTYYESGDLDRLLALYDVGSIGFWEAIRIRQDFQEFFRTTSSRRLRLSRVSWETAEKSARAKGAAALTAEYAGEPGGRLERNVELELDVIVRDGQPRIARLSLFPHAR